MAVLQELKQAVGAHGVMNEAVAGKALDALKECKEFLKSH